MNSSGSNKAYRTDGADVYLYIITAFCLFVVLIVGWQCCRRKRSLGKSRASRRLLKRRQAGKSTAESGNELLNASLSSTNKDLRYQLEEKADPTCSSVKKSKKTKKEAFSSSSSNSSPNGYRRNRNSRTESKRSGLPSILDKVLYTLRRRDDVESCNQSLLSSKKADKFNAIITNKKMEQNTDANPKRSDSVPEEMEIDKEKEKTHKKPEQPHTSRPPQSSQQLLGIKKNGKEGVVKYKKPSLKRPCSGSDCPGRDCKKCKPYKDEPEVHITQIQVQLSAAGKSPPNSQPVKKSTLEGSNNPPILTAKLVEEKPSETTTVHQSFSVMHVDEKAGKIMKDKTERVQENSVEYPVDHDMVELEDKEFLEPPFHTTVASSLLANAHESVLKSEKRVESIGEVHNVIEYASREWRGDTAKAQAVRKGYSEVPKQLGLHNLRVIRGDNYCAIRATLFQALVKKIPILAKFGDIQKVPKQMLLEENYWINEWNFGARIGVDRNEVHQGMEKCLTELQNLANLNNKMENEEGRVSHLLSSLNYKDKEFELRLLEGVKLLMLSTAVELHKLMTSGQTVPTFAVIMFARDTSPDPHQFMKKHLNAVGDTGGLEQVEMHLLGYSLGIIIRVVRPSHFGQSDFIASYPEDMPRDTPSITLVAEDDRHYNILT